MATYYSQASDVWSTLTNWDTNSGGGGSHPSSVADMDDDLFIIQAGHTITLDVDMTAWSNGIAGLTITGSNVNNDPTSASGPGMLRADFTNTATNVLKIKSAINVIGTNTTYFGKILANSDGVWGNTGVLPWGKTFVILLAGTSSASYITATYLDIALYCDEPTNKYVETYGPNMLTVTGSAANDTLTISGANTLTNNRGVMFKVSGGSLPASRLVSVGDGGIVPPSPFMEQSAWL